MDSNNDPKHKQRGHFAYYIGLAIAMLVVMIGFLVQDNYTATGHVNRLQAANAHSWLRYAAMLLEEQQDPAAAAQRLPALVKEMMAQDPRILELHVLKGTKFLFHSDPEKNGQRIDPQDEADKQTYDDHTQIKFRLKKKVPEKYLVRITPDHPAEGQAMLTLVEPILKSKRKSAGVVKLKYRCDATAPGGFVSILVLGMGLMLGCGLVFRWLHRYRWLIAVPAVLLFTLAGLYLAGNHADSLYDDGFNQKGAHLQKVLQLMQQQDPGSREAYLAGLKKEGLKGFYPEFKPFLPADQGSLDMTPDEDYRQEQRQAFYKRTRTVSIVFLAAALLLLAFIMAGYAFRTLSAVKKHCYSYIYIFPAMTGMVVLVFFPFVYGVTMGFFKITHKEWEFTGLGNFITILSDFQPFTPGNFYFTLLVTVMWTVVNVALHVGIGLILALVLNRPNMRLKKVYRVLLILPWAIPNYITALIWKGMFHKQFGAINAFLEVLGIEAVSWFNNFWTAFFANVATNTWLGFPFMMVISLGALQSIPAYLYEAAEVDGASKWQQFRNITLPLLKPALFPAVVLGTIWTFNMFNIIYLVSNGALDRSTDILITQAFRYAFEEFNWGFAAAYSIIIFLILLAYGTFSNRATRATEGVFD